MILKIFFINISLPPRTVSQEVLRDAVELLNQVNKGTTKITIKASADSSTHPEENSVIANSSARGPPRVPGTTLIHYREI